MSVKRLHSIRSRYFFIALSSVAVVLIMITFVEQFVSRSNLQLLDNIEHRLEVDRLTDSLHNSITHANQILDLYLINPSENYRTSFNKDIAAGLEIAQVLARNSWAEANLLGGETKSIVDRFHILLESSNRLMAVRLNANEMFPAMKLANGIMLDANRSFVSSVTFALTESEQGTTKIERKVYSQLLLIRDEWRKLINAYRLYLINRLGSFFERELKSQENDVHTFMRVLSDRLNELQLIADRSELGFETDAALIDMKTQSQTWYAGFNQSVILNRSKEWRGDIPILLRDIYPVIEQILASLNQIDNKLNLSSTRDVKQQHRTSSKISYSLWFIVAIMILVVFISYIVVDRSLLKPISTLVSSIRGNHEGNVEHLTPTVNNSELYEFVNAYRTMQIQINNRQAQLEHMAMHDKLTGLPNRSLFIDRLKNSIAVGHRQKNQFAIMIMDMNHFKEVNDTLGHLTGDKLLCEVAFRLELLLRDMDTVARLGGDEFAILLQDLSMESIKSVALKICDSLEQVYTIGDHDLYLSASVGIAIYPDHGQTTEILLKNADVAMYSAKQANSRFNVYDPKMDIHDIQKLSLLSELKMAIDENQLFLVFQPIVSADKIDLLGFEALTRWRHPKMGIVPPGEFIPLAEQTGLIKRISVWAIEQALSCCKRLYEKQPSIYISVNITAWDLQDDTLIQAIVYSLNKHELPSSVLVLELTERSMMTETLRVRHTLEKIHQLGVRFSIDDFGTGFSSLTYLQQLPISILKVDRSFVASMLTESSDALIVRSIIELAHNLKLGVVAEGVEEERIRNMLIEFGCESIQGYLISKPVPEDELKQFV